MTDVSAAAGMNSAMKPSAQAVSPAAHQPPFGAAYKPNGIGLWTLIRKETERFWRVQIQTVWAPVMTSLLYYMIFSLGFGANARPPLNGVPFLMFLAPGLMMMSMAQNSFANTSSSIVIAKIQGTIVDLLLTPLGPMSLVTGYVFGGVLRGLAVGIATWLAFLPFVRIMPVHPFFVLFHAVMGSMMLSLLGIIGGVWAEKFDHLAVVTNFIVMPATFLSGTFYTASRMPGAWSLLCHLNPFFYMIDGFRYGFIGVSDGTLGVGIILMLAMNGVLWFAAFSMFRTGYRLKS